MRLLHSIPCIAAAALAIAAVSADMHAREPAETAASRVTSVTVYPSGAEVTRLAEVPLVAGRQEVVVAGLPANLRDDSLRLRFLDDAELWLEDLRTERVYLTEPAHERVRELESRIQELREEIADSDDLRTLLQERREFLNQLRESLVSGGASESDPRAVSTDRWRELMAFWSGELEDTIAALRAVQRERADLERRLDALERELAGLRSHSRREGRNARVTIRSAETGTARIALVYQVREAGWRSDYRLQADSGTREAHLELFGLVTQNTGEDWTDARLTLSTAQPARPGTIPVLPARYLSVHSPDDARGYSARVLRAPESLRVEADALPAAAEIEQTLTATAFHAPEPVAIASGADRARIFLSRWDLDGVWRVHSVPRVRPEAFLTLESQSLAEVVLPAGSMSVHADGALIGSSRLATTLPGDEIILSLGVDEGIGVVWTLKERFRDTAGVIQRRTRIRYTYEIELRNSRQEVVVALLDRVPVSRDERITVRVHTAPGGAEPPDEEGTLEWKVTLAPGETRAFTIQYTVEFPPDVTVSGLE